MRDDAWRRDPAAYPWSLEIATRFGDMDLNGHLNNVAVARLYEEGRVRFVQGLRDRHGLGRPRFVVVRVEVDYLAEARYPAPVTIAAGMLAVGRSSWRIGLALFQAGGCLGLCDTVLVHRGGDGGPAPLPDALRTALGEVACRP